MTRGYVAKNQVPYIFVFDDDEKVELIASLLEEGLNYHYDYMSFFQFDNGEYDEEE